MRSKKRKEPVSPDRIQVYAWVIIAAAILVIAAVRIHLLPIPLERDEGEYAYAGQLILQKIPPYALACNMKFPGVYFAYALIMAIFGQTPTGIHLGLLFVNAAAIVLVFLLGQRLFDTRAGVTAAISYGMLCLSPSVLGFQAHATHFVVLAALGGILLVLKSAETRRLGSAFWAGLMMGISLLMKQHGLFLLVFAALYLIWEHVQTRSIPWGEVAKKTAAFALGAIIPIGLLTVLLVESHNFARFWFWTVEYSMSYVSETPLRVGFQNFMFCYKIILRSSLVLWILAGIGLLSPIWYAKAKAKWFFSTGLAIFSFLAICPGLYFRNHYFVLLLPAVALLTGVGLNSLHSEILRTRKAPAGLDNVLRTWFYVGALTIAVGTSLYCQNLYLFQLTPIEACYYTYNHDGNPFPESIEIARYIREHSKETDTIGMLGSEPQICFYAHRHSASSTLYMYPLMEIQPFALTMQRETIAEMERAKPKFMVVVETPGSWLPQPNSQQLIRTWASQYLRDYYAPVGIASLFGTYPTDYRWDDDGDSIVPTSRNFVIVLKRK